MRRGYLLDTNQITKAVTSGASSVSVRLRDVIARGAIVGTHIPVLCEAQVGFSGDASGSKYRAELQHLLRQIRIWPMTVDTAMEFGIVSRETRTKGRALSQVDLMLAALARQMRLILVTADRDFDALPDIPSDNWVV